MVESVAQETEGISEEQNPGADSTTGALLEHYWCTTCAAALLLHYNVPVSHCIVSGVLLDEVGSTHVAVRIMLV